MIKCFKLIKVTRQREVIYIGKAKDIISDGAGSGALNRWSLKFVPV
jgi:hypothetical protein